MGFCASDRTETSETGAGPEPEIGTPPPPPHPGDQRLTGSFETQNSSQRQS